jgi:hypothetical protein
VEVAPEPAGAALSPVVPERINVATTDDGARQLTETIAANRFLRKRTGPAHITAGPGFLLQSALHLGD